jgi:hypothetical protein
MIQKILRGYRRLLGALMKVLAIVAVCVGFGFLLVYPLCLFASSHPGAYTVVVFCALLAALAVFAASKLRVSLRGASKEERRKKLAAIALKAAKTAVVILGAYAACALVLRGMRLGALVAVILAAALYGLCAFGAKNG